MLLFNDASCRPCMELLPTFMRWRRDYRDHVTIEVIISGSSEELWTTKRELPDGVLAQADRKVADAYKAHVTPSAVVVTAEGNIGSRLAVGQGQIETLVESLLARGRRSV
jgi:hypothetical protein